MKGFCIRLVTNIWVVFLAESGFAFQSTVYEDRALFGHVCAIHSVDWLNCLRTCNEEPRCVSYNYYDRRTNSIGLCELNDSGLETLCDGDKSLIYSPGFVFQQLRKNEGRPSVGTCQSTDQNISATSVINSVTNEAESAFPSSRSSASLTERTSLRMAQSVYQNQTSSSVSQSSTANRYTLSASGTEKTTQLQSRDAAIPTASASNWPQTNVSSILTPNASLSTKTSGNASNWPPTHVPSSLTPNASLSTKASGNASQRVSPSQLVTSTTQSIPVLPSFISSFPSVTTTGTTTPVMMRRNLTGVAFSFPQDPHNAAVFIGGMRSMTAVTICYWMKSHGCNRGHIFSYALHHTNNELSVGNYENLKISIGSKSRKTNVSANDGEWHHICVTWENTAGLWIVYKDGQVEASGSRFQIGHVIKSGGILVLGQDQDSFGGGFEKDQNFVGDLTGVNLWDFVKTHIDISIMSRSCLTGQGGNVIKWYDLPYRIQGKLNEVNLSSCLF